MPLGPGKYDDLCTYVREKAHAASAIVIIGGGDKGAGFSMQAPFVELIKLPHILRTVADEIEESLKRGQV